MNILTRKIVIKFINYYSLIILTILILDHITNSVQIGQWSKSTDAIYFKNRTNNYYISQILRRYTRQTISNDENCEVPISQHHTKYTILGESPTNYTSGDFVINFSVLEISCASGYHLNHLKSNVSICLNGKWKESPTACIRTCTSLISTKTTRVKCRYNNIPLENCINPVSGTIALMSCNPLYEEYSIEKNPVRVCREGRWDRSIPQCYPTCGIKHPRGNSNIVNGTNATIGDYPWQVGIYDRIKKELICGGSIIEENIILSAAHCFTDYNGNVQPVGDYLVAAGKYFRDYNDERDQLSQYSNIQEIHVPERYKGRLNMFALDIAILIISDPFILSESVQPVCIELNEESQYLDLSLNNNGIVTGWGYTVGGGELSEVLKELIIPYIPFNKCFNEVPEHFQRYITYDKICGGFIDNGMSVCGGDSGGSLVFKNIFNDRYFVKGIVSTSPATEELVCNSNQYSTFTSVAHHSSFVRDLVALNQPQRPVECTHDECTNEDIIKNENQDWQIGGNVSNGCRLPDMPQHGEYVLVNNEFYVPGNYVQITTEITVICKDKYTVVPTGITSSFCVDTGNWQPRLGICTRTCSSIISTNSTKVECKLNNISLETCLNPIENTVATISCEPFYEDRNIQQSSVRHCINGTWDYPITQCSPVCGTATRDNMVLANGNTTNALIYPWKAVVYNIEHEYMCLGCIISPRIVLSVAHCFANDYGEAYPNENYLIAAGKRYYKYNDDRDTQVQYAKIDAIHLHESFSGNISNFEADIAIIVLSTQLTLTINVQPVCIDFEAVYQPTINQAVLGLGMVSAWQVSDNENGTQLDVLIERNVKILSHEYCFMVVQRPFRKYLSPDKTCAGTILCLGNDGSPLVTLNSSTNRYYLTAILSRTRFTLLAGVCNQTQFSTYTVISRYIDFINTHWLI